MADRLFDANESAGWIVIEKWTEFQHYPPDSRRLIWIKNYIDLLDKDEYVDLSPATRALLHGLWLLTARTHGSIRGVTAKLSRALGMQVRQQQLEALRDAGFIRFSASKPASKVASVEEKRLKEKRTSLRSEATNGSGDEELISSLTDLGLTPKQRFRALQFPEAEVRIWLERTQRDVVLNPAAYFVTEVETAELLAERRAESTPLKRAQRWVARYAGRLAPEDARLIFLDHFGELEEDDRKRLLAEING